jgi:hypothetical protein
MVKVNIEEVCGNDLYEHYYGQTDAQDCQVVLDCETGRLWAEACSGRNGVPVKEYHRVWLTWSIERLKASVANDLLAEIAPLAQRILGGFEATWDGHNHVGEYTTEAETASDDINELCLRCNDPTDCLQVWDAFDWLNDLSAAALGITAETTDDDLDAIADRVRNEAANDDVDVLENLDKCLQYKRSLVRTVGNE